MAVQAVGVRVERRDVGALVVIVPVPVKPAKDANHSEAVRITNIGNGGDRLVRRGREAPGRRAAGIGVKEARAVISVPSGDGATAVGRN